MTHLNLPTGGARVACLAFAVSLLAGCTAAPITPSFPAVDQTAAPLPAATGSASVSVALAGLAPTLPSTMSRGDEGIQATLNDYRVATGDDPTGMKRSAYMTLSQFADPHGPYSGAWWFANDGRVEIGEVLAVILYTEGNTSWDVRTAVLARYLWYCGGLGSRCQGAALINFLSYFQPWREPWAAPGFISPHAEQYQSLADDLVNQHAGLLTAMIPGADAYVRSSDGLSLAGPVDWFHTSFHFANVDPTWDGYLRTQLHRLPNGPARLWVLTMGEAGRVCGSRFICADMTTPKLGGE